MPRSFDPFLLGQLPRSHDPSVRINSNTPKITLDLEDLLNMYRDWWVNIGFPLLEELTGVDLSAFLPLINQAFEALKMLFGAANILSPDFDPIAAGVYFITHVLNPTNLLASVEALVQALTGISGGSLSFLGPLAGLFGSFLGNGDGTITGLSDDLFVDNGDGTWSFLDDGLHGLFDGGDGILSSPITLLQNILGNLGTYQSTLDRQQSIIDNLFNAVNYTNIFGNQVESLITALRNIPFLNVLGVGGPTNIGNSILTLVNQLVGGFVGAPGTGASFPDVFNMANLISSNAALGLLGWDILGIRNNKSMLTGMLPTSVSPVSFQKITSGASATTFGVTSTTATTLWHRFAEGLSLGVISWLGYGTTSITDMRVNIWKMNPLTGTQSLAHASANIIGNVSGSGTPQYNTYTIPTPIAVNAADVYGAEIEVRAGAGTHTIAGEQSWEPSHPTVFPRKMQSRRNSGGTTPPSSIVTGSIDYATTNRPYIEFAVEAGVGSEFHETQRSQISSSATVVVPNWVDLVDIAELPGAGGANGGTGQIGLVGKGGNNGAWATTTWERGVHFDAASTPVLTITIGNGGAGGGIASAGSNGQATSVTLPATTGHPAITLSTAGGTAGSGYTTPGSAQDGHSPGNITYLGYTYVGGGTQGSVGAAGVFPGGGGCGGGYLASGGPGAKGSAWIVFR